jgi:hypothetical protein
MGLTRFWDKGKDQPFLGMLRGLTLWGTLRQVFRRFPLLHPLVFLMLHPKLAVVIPWLISRENNLVRERVECRNNIKYPDYLAQFIPTDGSQIPAEDYLTAQANHLIIGGFDPGTNWLSSTVYFLLKTPKTLGKLQAEVRGSFSTDDEISNDRLQNLQYLNAVLEESLRIHTNGAFGMPRTSPGSIVNGHYIPNGVLSTQTFKWI